MSSTTIDTTAVVFDMPEPQYRAHPALSSTGARRILSSPARFRWESEHPPVVSEAFDVGHAVHTLVLGAGDPLEVLDFDSWRTKAAQEARDDARAAGRVPILAKDAEPLHAMAEAVLAHPIARAIFDGDGDAEASLFADDPETGVALKARPDWLRPREQRRTIIADLKTAVDASRQGFTKAAANLGYDVQDVWYRRVLSLARGDEDMAFVFVVVEKEPPHLVAVHQLNDEFDAIGTARMRRAITTYAACLAADDWPGYPAEVQIISPPRWLAIAEEENDL